ncbi:phosphatidylglycerophosphatase A family protein [Gimibacter soli]|uniref:Phosphatidylglycerophosphatase A n=1 Tax=Gimibacter soli TaxID=3024400 RepID=A0AAF0BJB6_9PROT|nr:phosphatidylglycerophosphatase A [Gimibacter soli]WCL52934.1 phosphatidylglycerophosphatase A [Gimibacter soli]
MKQSLGAWDDRYKSLAFWIATFFGSGLLKPAPGTWGSLAGLAAGMLLIAAGIDEAQLIGFIAALTIAGSKAINAIEAKTGIHDAPEIVIDEVAGIWIALLPVMAMGITWQEAAAAFTLFRLFDIWKPWPISWIDRHVHGGFGVMADDLVAGILAAIILVIIHPYLGM